MQLRRIHSRCDISLKIPPPKNSIVQLAQASPKCAIDNFIHWFRILKGAPTLSQPGGIWWPRPEQCHVPVHYIGLMLISASRKCSSTEKDSAKKLHHITFNWRRLSFGLLVFVSLADCFAAPSWFIFCWNFGWISEREKCGLGWQHCHCQVAANLICSSIWFTAR